MAGIGSKLSETIALAEKITRETKEEIKTAVRALPGNPATTKLSDKPRCFLLSSAKLEGYLDPFYYDFEGQYAKIIEVVESIPLDKLSAEINVIIESGVIEDRNGKFRFHPTVRSYLKEIMAGGNGVTA